MKVAEKLLLWIAKETNNPTAAIVFLILSKRQNGDINANHKLFDEYGISRHVLYKALTDLKELGLIRIAYSVANQRQVLIIKQT